MGVKNDSQTSESDMIFFRHNVRIKTCVNFDSDPNAFGPLFFFNWSSEINLRLRIEALVYES